MNNCHLPGTRDLSIPLSFKKSSYSSDMCLLPLGVKPVLAPRIQGGNDVAPALKRAQLGGWGDPKQIVQQPKWEVLQLRL